MNSCKRGTLVAVTAAAFLALPHTQAAAEDGDSIRRKTPSGQYVDPSSFFRFHGYISTNSIIRSRRYRISPAETSRSPLRSEIR